MRDAGRAIVIGAGIVGAACALELAREGFLVTVIDAGPVGGGATAAGMGHIVAMDDSDAQFALTKYSQDLWKELSPQLPISAEVMNCGTVWVAADEEEMVEVARKHAYYAERGVESRILSAAQLQIAEPNLRDDLAGGLLVPPDSVVYPPAIAGWMLKKAAQLKAVVMPYTPVSLILPNGAVVTRREKLQADVVVNACGALSPKLTPGLQIKPRKGHLVITDRYTGFVRHQLVELGYLKSAHKTTGDSVAFNVQPRPTGQMLLGSSRQYDDDPRVDPKILSRMIARAVEYMPRIAELSTIRVWTGFRAATADKLPLIGRWNEVETLWLATGHEGLGITTSLATAKLLVDQILDRPSRIPVGPYLPGRLRSLEASHG